MDRYELLKYFVLILFNGLIIVRLPLVFPAVVDRIVMLLEILSHLSYDLLQHQITDTDLDFSGISAGVIIKRLFDTLTFKLLTFSKRKSFSMSQ